MNAKDMAELVEELRKAIAEADSLSDEDRAQLDELATKIEDESEESLLESVDDAVNRFEVEHAGVVRVINRIADALAAGGI